MNTNLFHSMEIEGWRQFEDVDIQFHPRLTIITGTNGSGKSTLISICARHFGWNRSYLSTPVKDAHGQTSYLSGIVSKVWHKLRNSRNETNQPAIGKLSYTNGEVTQITMPTNNSSQYSLTLSNQQQVFGIHVDSYRPAPNYSVVQNIPIVAVTSQQAYDNYNSEVIIRNNGGHSQFSPIYRLKETLISMATFGEGNSTIGQNDAIHLVFKGFSDILLKLLPKEIGFIRIAIRVPEVVLITKSGEFMLDAASGGVSTILDIAWRIHIFSQNKDRFVVSMDEPENHLHPSMQRSLMRNLLDAFPKAQFIVATHSPFIVSSVKESYVYVLRYDGGATVEDSSLIYDRGIIAADASSRVKSLRLDNVDKAGTASEILREVLGVPVTMPEWVEDEVANVTKKFIGAPITTDMLARLRAELSMLGYNEYFPEALARIAR